jgi:hypothetical protein
MAHAFFDTIVRLNEIPSSSVNDRDSVFTNQFWQELFSFVEVQLKLSSAFHPQTDNQFEATNKVITMYLRCLFDDCPRHWVHWLPWAEFCYNSAYQASLRTSLFWVVYDHDPPLICAYSCGTERLASVHNRMLEHDEFLAKSGTTESRHNNTTRSSMIKSTTRWNLKLLSGSEGPCQAWSQIISAIQNHGTHRHGSLHVAATGERQATRRLPWR